MRIMIDANVIYSAYILPDSSIANIVKHIKLNHTLVLCKHVIDEVESTIINKRPHDFLYIKRFINDLPDDVFVLGNYNIADYPPIRDLKDLPILISAIQSKVDIFITGDKDFDEVRIDKPRILKPRQYQDEFMS